MEPTQRADIIERKLRDYLGAEHVDVIDDSARHVGHVGADGGGHFRVRVISSRFEGRSRIQKQRLVYEALADMMTHDIHALQMETLTPSEWRERVGA
jgi:BolA protein